MLGKEVAQQLLLGWVIGFSVPHFFLGCPAITVWTFKDHLSSIYPPVVQYQRNPTEFLQNIRVLRVFPTSIQLTSWPPSNQLKAHHPIQALLRWPLERNVKKKNSPDFDPRELSMWSISDWPFSVSRELIKHGNKGAHPRPIYINLSKENLTWLSRRWTLQTLHYVEVSL